MKLLNLKRQSGAKNTNFRMYKAGRKWVFGSLLTLGLLGGIGMSQVLPVSNPVVRAETMAPGKVKSSDTLVPGGSLALQQKVNIDQNTAKDYFSLIRTTLNSLETTTAPLDNSGAITILNSYNQNANVVMNNQFDMSDTVDLSGTFVVGKSNGVTSDSGAPALEKDYQAPGDGLGIILANVDPSQIALGTPGNGDKNMGIVGLPKESKPLFIGWDMFGNKTAVSGQEYTDNKRQNTNGSFALAQLNTFSLNSDGTGIVANEPGNALEGNFEAGTPDFLAGQTVQWSFNWTPATGTTAATDPVQGEMTYTIKMGSEKIGQIKYGTTVPKSMAIAMHMSSGWAYSNTDISMTGGTFKAAQGNLTVNYMNSGTTNAPSDLASTEITGNIGDGYAFDGVTTDPVADHTFIAPTVAGKIPLYSQDKLEYFTKAPQTANVGYISNPALVEKAGTDAEKEVADRYAALNNAITNAHLTDEQMKDPTFVDAKAIADAAAGGFPKVIGDLVDKLKAAEDAAQVAVNKGSEADVKAASDAIDKIKDEIATAQKDADEKIQAAWDALKNLTNQGNGGNTGNGVGGTNPGDDGNNNNNGNGNNTNGDPLYNTIATIVQQEGQTALYDRANGNIIGQRLLVGTDWRAFRQYTDGKGMTWYNLGGDQWIKGTGVILDARLGSYKKLQTVGTVKKNTTATVYSLPGTMGKATGQKLTEFTAWKVFATVVTADGQRWYQVGTNQWVKAADVDLHTIEPFQDVVVIDYAPGYGVNVWSTPLGNQATGQRLQTGSTWKVFAKSTDAYGNVFYNLGGNQWINKVYTKQALSAAGQAIHKNTTTINVPSGQNVKTWTAPGSKVAAATLIKTTKVRVLSIKKLNNVQWYQVGEKQWIEATHTNGVK
ncbi:SLAP domain-containing protein [Lacticaseibacillus saniviri]